MTTHLTTLTLLGCLLLRSQAAEPTGSLPMAPIAEPEKTGRALAAQLRAKGPEEPVKFTGQLRIMPRGGENRAVRVSCTVQPGQTNGPVTSWAATYVLPADGAVPPEQLRIQFAAGRANEYFHVRGPAAGKPIDASAKMPNEKAEVPLGGSDFWLTDLGLEFLHWPVQRVLRAEMRRGQPCRVLESVNPKPTAGGYARVVSWVARMDEEVEGILQAEAYDRQNLLLKEFSLGSFRKVDGRWQLQDMKIRNAQTGSRTWLEFELKK